ncbi:MAG TPA: hypothetical protein ENJ09_11595 [Planctomycetes bacterium]|nr:hypothetical protein [Planctomycetota bacterium]
MRNVFLLTLAPLLLTASAAQAQDDAPKSHDSAPVQEGADPSAAGTRATDGRMMSPFETARRLAKAWPLAVYTIKRGKRDVGVYVQRNTMSEVDGAKTIEYFDTIKYPRKNQSTLVQTMCGTEQRFNILGMAGKMQVGQMKVQMEDGRLKGMQFGQTPVDIEAPEFFVTDLSLLRRPYGVLFREGETYTWPHLKVEAMPGKDCFREGVFECLGLRQLKLDGESFDAWKFSWTVGEERPIFIWYGNDGQLLKRVFRKETWLYSPTRTAKALAKDAGPSAKDKDADPPGRRD